MSFLFTPFSTVLANSSGYPKLANYYLKTPISNAEISELAKWDVVILGMQVQDTSPDVFQLLRILNPQIKIIAYLSSMEFPNGIYNIIESSNGPWHKMRNSISDKWFLKDGSGNIHSIWPGNYSFNLTKYCPEYNGQKFNEWLPTFVKTELMETGNWDGVFYDNLLYGIKSTNNGQVDEQAWVDQAWREGSLELLKNTRNIIGSDKILMVNSSSYGKEYINGRLYETWPDKWQGGWDKQMQDYKNLESSIKYSPQVIVVNPNTENSGNSNDFKKVRFGLASTLQGNGYFAFDWGTQDHSQLWWYDEYDAELGYPNSQSQEIKTNVLRRDFTKGVALVNGTQQTQTIDLGSGVYEKLRGGQDSAVNNGELVKKVDLPAQDGLLLLKKLEYTSPSISAKQEAVEQDSLLEGVVFTNGDYVRVFDKRGNVKRTGFYAYDERFAGGVQILISDIDNDKENETVVADESKIRIFKADGSLAHTFYPFGENFRNGLNLAVGNVQGDERQEILVAPQKGQPIIKIFGDNGCLISDGWLAYAPDFYGGVKIALGDLNGNGYQEIITGTGVGGGPHVRIFNASGYLFDPGFFPYDENFRGGVNVTCADLNSDGKDEIITGAGPSGGPHVRIYDKIGHLVDPGFFAFDENKREGVKVGAADVDGDGNVEILGMN